MLLICDCCGRNLGLLGAAGEFRNDDCREHGKDDEHEEHLDEGEGRVSMWGTAMVAFMDVVMGA